MIEDENQQQHNKNEQASSDPIIEKLTQLESRDWINDLKNSENFSGNPQNASILINNMIVGMREAYLIHKNEGDLPEDYVLPKVVFSSNRNAGVSVDKNQILIPVQTLSSESTYSVDSEKYDINGFPIPIQDDWLLTGAEELDHTVEASKGEEIQINYVKNSMARSIAHYDSSDIESRGLNTQMKVAQKLNMSQSVTDGLRFRMQNAVKERQKRMKTKNMFRRWSSGKNKS